MSAINIIFGLLFSILYIALVNKSVDVYLGELPKDDKIHTAILIIFAISTVSIMLAKTIFANHPALKNEIVRTGLITGGIFVISHIVIMNWINITERYKLSIIVILFGLFVWYVYADKQTQPDEVDIELVKKKSKAKTKRVKDIDTDTDKKINENAETSEQ